MKRARITLVVFMAVPLLVYSAGLSWRSWRQRPPDPAQIIPALSVPLGFSVDLVASEPDIVHPVAMTFDDQGRLWIIETYTNVPDEARPLPNRIKILTSSQGDGKFDSIATFPAPLKMPSSLAIGYGGVWIADAPDILFFPLRDGVPGPAQVVVSGFGNQNTNGLPNSLTWGPDGWLYGLSSVWCKNHVVHQGKTFDFTCALFRIHPRSHAFELFAEGTSNPWGLTWDSEGSAFVNTCVTDHLWHLTETGVYNRIVGVSPAFSWRLGSIVQHQHAGHSHCGLLFFDSDAYPPQYRDKLFMGNVSYGAINIDGLDRNGATYRGTPFPDFMRCSNPWFTPVSQKIGPDGLLYILDWYDRNHCESDMLRMRRSAVEPFGRLYRVRHGEYRSAGTFDLAHENDAQLIDRLHGPNSYFRERAQRLLVERASPAIARMLRQPVLNDQEPRKARMHALWALVGSGALDPAFHLALLQHADPGFRAWGVRAAGNFHRVTPAIRARIAALARDPSPDVRLQVAIAVRKIEDTDAVPILVEVAAASAGDPLIPAIVWQNLLPLLDQRGSDFLARVEKMDRKKSAGMAPIVARVVDYLVARPGQDPAKIVALFKTMTEQGQVDTAAVRTILVCVTEKIQTGEMTATQLDSLLDSVRTFVHRVLRGKPNDPLYLEAALLGATLKDSEGIEVARLVFASPRRTDEVPLNALAALTTGGDSRLLDQAAAIPTDPKAGSLSFRGQVLTALGRMEDERVAALVLERYPHLEADLQPRAIELLLQRPAWSKQLLQAVSKRKVPASSLNINQVRQLLASKDPELAKQVKAQWGTLRQERDPERERVVVRMRSFLRDKHGDPARGMKVFHQLCGQCHKIYGEGADVGPDLTLTGRTSYDQLLTKVFDPNQFIKAGYQFVTAYTTKGRVVTGLVIEDNSSRMVLNTQGGKRETIPRDDVEMTAASKVSLMPEGMEKQLQPEEIADLFAFLTLDRRPGDPQARKIPGAPP